MRRNPRADTGLTKTQQLRQARAAALIQDLEKRQETEKKQVNPFGRRKRVVMPEPKKVDFKKPGLTKAMLARMKHAEKFIQEYERKTEATVSSDRVPKRTPAPIGGDSRMGRERLLPPKGKARTPVASPPRTSPVARKDLPAGISPVKTKLPQQALPKKTNELAKVLNADVIQAEPIGKGPISNIVIPPGTVNNDRTTIVSVPQSPVQIETKMTSQMANRSIQMISETLNEQDAVEVKAVNNKLSELQQARRDFVIAVANVGGNVVNIADETPPADFSFLSDSRSPELDNEFLQAQYENVPSDILYARELMQKALADMEEREAARRLEEEFERVAASEYMPDDLQLNVPFEDQLYQDKDTFWEEDEDIGTAMPRPSRPRAHKSPVPMEQKSYPYKSFDIQELERFFDLQRYPPCPKCGPPSGREGLHPDLWDLVDPWYRPPVQSDMQDLIEFDLMEF